MTGNKAEDYYTKNAKPTIKAVKNNKLSKKELKNLLTHEEENKNRVTVKKGINNKLEELEDEEEEFEAELDKISPEPIVNVEHEKLAKRDKIISGVSKSISDLTGVPLNVVRLAFLISFVLVIGIPIYFILSLFMHD